MNGQKNIYRLKITDVQNVARESFGRELTEAEVVKVEKHLGDYINWFELIETTIENHVINDL